MYDYHAHNTHCTSSALHFQIICELQMAILKKKWTSSKNNPFRLFNLHTWTSFGNNPSIGSLTLGV
jgi:hypothetical protein